MIRSQRFDVVAGIIICVNALVMALELEYNGLLVSGLGINGLDDTWPAADLTFLAFEHVFCWVFGFELMARLYAYGLSYFLAVTNWVDAVIVIMSILEIYVMKMFQVALPNMTFIRLVRLVKLTKVLRVVRVMRFFHQLRVLVISIVSSVG